MMPHDLVSKYVAPQLRSLVAHKLSARGLSQEKIASLMGVSQPMVSKYLRSSLEKVLERLASYGVDPGEAEAVADTLASLLRRGDLEGYQRLLYSYMNTLLVRRDLCSLHRRLDSRVPPTCNICAALFQPSVDPLVHEVEEAVKSFVSAPGVERLVPQVGSNIVAARPGARSVADVVGLSGGIVRDRGGVAVVGRPSYGGSRHTAGVLLAAYRRWKELRAAVVIAFSEECVDALRRSGLSVLTSGPHERPEAQLPAIEAAVSSARRPPDALADAGGYGLEPVIYVFGPTALKAVEKALLCLGAQSLGFPSSV